MCSYSSVLLWTYFVSSHSLSRYSGEQGLFSLLIRIVFLCIHVSLLRVTSGRCLQEPAITETDTNSRVQRILQEYSSKKDAHKVFVNESTSIWIYDVN